MLFATHLLRALRRHWPHYLVEAAGIMAFLVFSSVAAVVCLHPDSAVARALGPQAWVQRIGVGLVVGGLIAAMAYSPWGKRSGAHFNPAVTLGFWQLGHIRTADAVWYVVAQFGGALVAGAGIYRLLAPWFGHPAVHYNTTRPPEGAYGWVIALGAELLISGALLLAMLWSFALGPVQAVDRGNCRAAAGAVCGGGGSAFGHEPEPRPHAGQRRGGRGHPGLWLYFLGPLAAAWVAAGAFGRWRKRHFATAHPPVYPDASA